MSDRAAIQRVRADERSTLATNSALPSRRLEQSARGGLPPYLLALGKTIPPGLSLSTSVKTKAVTSFAEFKEFGEPVQEPSTFYVAIKKEVLSQPGLLAIRSGQSTGLGKTDPRNYTGKAPLFEQDESLLEGKQSRARVKRTVSKAPDTFTLYLGPGKYIYAPGGGPGHEEYLIVDRPFSDLILQGEEEHIRDFDLAYQLSWKRIEDIINMLASKEAPLQATPREAKLFARRAFLEKLKELGPQFVPDNIDDPQSQKIKWLNLLKGLQELSKQRDDRFWHDLPLHREMSNDGNHWEWKFDPSQTLHLGHPSQEIIHF